MLSQNLVSTILSHEYTHSKRRLVTFLVAPGATESAQSPNRLFCRKLWRRKEAKRVVGLICGRIGIGEGVESTDCKSALSGFLFPQKAKDRIYNFFRLLFLGKMSTCFKFNSLKVCKTTLKLFKVMRFNYRILHSPNE